MTDIFAAPPEAPIRALLADMRQAIAAGDVDAVMAYYAPDVLTFDLLPPMKYEGAGAVRERLAAWLGSFHGPIAFTMRDLSIAAGDDVAFCHSINGVRGKTKDGASVDMWWRATSGLQKIHGRWLVTHGHSSEPFDADSGKAVTNLKP